MAQLVSVALIFGAISSCLATRVGEDRNSGDTNNSCGDGWKALCVEKLEASALLMAAVAVDDEFCDDKVVELSSISQCSGMSQENSKSIQEKCTDKISNAKAYGKTEFVDDLKNLCWARLPQEVWNISWTDWATAVAGSIILYTWPIPDWTDLLEQFDIDNNGDISLDESCLLSRGAPWGTMMDWNINQEPPNIPDEDLKWLKNEAMLSSVMCNLSVPLSFTRLELGNQTCTMQNKTSVEEDACQEAGQRLNLTYLLTTMNNTLRPHGCIWTKNTKNGNLRARWNEANGTGWASANFGSICRE